MADNVYESMKTRALRLLQDLDRCEHGRHSIDHCLMCPGGQSTGNLLLKPGTVLGHSYDGTKIVVPDPATEIFSDPMKWFAR